MHEGRRTRSAETLAVRGPGDGLTNKNREPGQDNKKKDIQGRHDGLPANAL
jgi:hypothetical protein